MTGPPWSPVPRFEWERQLRNAPLSLLAKAACLLVATYMNADGTQARPVVHREAEHYTAASKPTLCDQLGRSRGSVLAALREATDAGWLTSIERPGRPTERHAAMPKSLFSALDPSSQSDGSSGLPVQPVGPLDPSSQSDGSDSSDGTRPASRTAPVQPVGPDQFKDQTRDQTTGTREEDQVLIVPEDREPSSPESLADRLRAQGVDWTSRDVDLAHRRLTKLLGDDTRAAGQANAVMVGFAQLPARHAIRSIGRFFASLSDSDLLARREVQEVTGRVRRRAKATTPSSTLGCEKCTDGWLGDIDDHLIPCSTCRPKTAAKIAARPTARIA